MSKKKRDKLQLKSDWRSSNSNSDLTSDLIDDNSTDMEMIKPSHGNSTIEERSRSRKLQQLQIQEKLRPRKPPKKLERRGNVTSLEDDSPKPLNVVVDVHRSNVDDDQSSNSFNDAEASAGKKEPKRSMKSAGASPKRVDNRDSLDLITDFQELEAETVLTEKFPSEDNQLNLEEKFDADSRRKRWHVASDRERILPREDSPVAASRRTRRKRWTKNMSIIHLPSDERRRKSSRSSSDSGLERSKPPTATPGGLQDEESPSSRTERGTTGSFFARENAAFEMESDEEVLRVETDIQDGTRIEMKSLENVAAGNEGPVSSLFSRTREIEEIPSEEDFDEDVAPKRKRKDAAGEDGTVPESSSSVKRSNRSSSQSSKKSFGKSGTGRKEHQGSPGSASSVSGKKGAEDKRRRKDEKKKQKKKKRKKTKELKFVSVTIHRSSILETDYVTRHPMVKVHIVQAETGRYLESPGDEDLQDSRTSRYLQPIITGKFDFQENKSMLPIWNEELIFEHDFRSILEPPSSKDAVLILFEVLDTLTFAEASCNYDQFGTEGCWYKIAWAFLRPVGNNDIKHVDKEVRLQLYRPKRNLKTIDRNTCEVYNWWRSSGNRVKYPGSLYVTVTSVDPPKLEPVFYQQLALQDFPATETNTCISQSETRKTVSSRASESISMPKWTRLAAQSCKIPNELLFQTDVSENGYFYVAFSNNGKFMVCVSSEEYDYPILVYTVEEAKIYVRFSGHKTFVYSLNWSNDDRFVLSVSSDHTARLWDVHEKLVQHVQLLPHPSYVYCGKFDPSTSSVVATGCYDHVTRIWAKDENLKTYELMQELEGHKGFINSLCFQKNGNLLTVDSIGIIIVWSVKKTRKLLSRKEWQISRKIKVREIEGVIVNSLVLHPMGSRLLVHSRNNGLRLLDLATGVVLQKYEGLKNQRIQLTACIAPCGGLIFCGGEDSSLKIWSLETGRLLGEYQIHQSAKTISCVDYHPYDHVLAFAAFGCSAAVTLLRFDKNSSGEKIGLKLFNEMEAIYSNRSVRNSSLYPRGNSTSRSLGLEMNDDERRRERVRLRLQKLNEMDQTLKSKSTNRLHNIIEKIDKILSSTKSTIDLEAGSCRVTRDEKKPPAVSVIELQEFTRENKDVRKRVKSAKERTSHRIFQDDDLGPKAFSDSAVNHRSRHSVVLEDIPGTKSSSSGSVVFQQYAAAVTDTTNEKILHSSPSLDSAGTYVLEKSEFEEINETVKVPGVASDSNSGGSNVTFTIESERMPVPKPRKKRVKQIVQGSIVQG